MKWMATIHKFNPQLVYSKPPQIMILDLICCLIRFLMLMTYDNDTF
jgi:hypothetical protein